MDSSTTSAAPAAQSAHTTGPIFIERPGLNPSDGDIRLTVKRPNGLRYPVAFLPRYTVYSTPQEMEANARLFQQAPELFDLALGVADMIDRAGLKVPEEFDRILRETIDQVEGRR